MKTPFNGNQNNHYAHSKPTSGSDTTRNTAVNNLNSALNPSFEPTSVLDVRRSSSPVSRVSDSVPGVQPVSGLLSDDPSLHWDDQPPLLSSDDWDSWMLVLGEKDDSAPAFKNQPQFGPFEPQNPQDPNLPHLDSFDSSSPFAYPDFNLPVHNQNQNLNLNRSSNFSPVLNLSNNFDHLQVGNEHNLDFDCLLLDQLIRVTEFFDSNELQRAQPILARLNHRLQSPVGKPLQRAAFYFKEALLSVVSDRLNPIDVSSSSSEIVQKIKAYKAFCEISPIAWLANFTANQALLESLDGDIFIHVIDFEIGLGGQWASFMQEIANKARVRNVRPSTLRITAVVTEEWSIESNLIRDNLYQFAQEVGIRFHLEFVPIRTFEILLFNSIRFIDGERVAVNLSPSILRHFNAIGSLTMFLRILRRISPQIVVFVDSEGWRDTGAPTFRQTFINGLEFYSNLLESLDATNTGGLDLMRRIERFLLRPKIFSAIAGAAAGRNHVSPWWELLSGIGMVPVPFSEFTESQAEFLVGRMQAKGFHLAKRQATMVLCWHQRELVATSAWKC